MRQESAAATAAADVLSESACFIFMLSCVYVDNIIRRKKGGCSEKCVGDVKHVD